MDPVAALIGRGATPQQASGIVYGSIALPTAVAGLWLADKTVAEAALIVIAVSAPRALLCLAARWGQSGQDSLLPELPQWRALRFER